MIKLYWFPRTRASRILWLLEELRQPFEVVKLDIRSAEARADPGFRAASPMGKVPAIADGDARVADSAAIALYLADRYPQAGLAPPVGDPLRASYLYWTVFTASAIEPAMMEKFNGWQVNPASCGWGNWDRVIETLLQGLGDADWLVGNRFSAADVLVGSSVYFMRLFGALPREAKLEAYADRCVARPAYARALARDAEDPA